MPDPVFSKLFLSGSNIKKQKTIGFDLATLLEGAGWSFFTVNQNVETLFFLLSFKCVKLDNKVIIVINVVSTAYLWRKNEEKVVGVVDVNNALQSHFII